MQNSAIDPQTLAHLQTWQGHTESLEDQITVAPVRALSSTLDRNDPAPVIGTELPPLWHWLYFLPHHAQSEIGADGHAKRGGFCLQCHCLEECGQVDVCNGMPP